MSENKKASVSYQIAIIGVLFFIFGFITWANGSLIPYLKIACELSSTQSYYVASAFFAAYFIMAIPSSINLKKDQDYKNGMSHRLICDGSWCFVVYSGSTNKNV
jgi:FHS family L-fucose permease-like MFS transporter